MNQCSDRNMTELPTVDSKVDLMALLACRKDFPRTPQTPKLLHLGEVIPAPTLFMAVPHFLSEALLLQILAWCDPSSWKEETNFLPGVGVVLAALTGQEFRLAYSN